MALPLLVMCEGGAMPLAAQDPDEYVLKATFLRNLPSFVAWPPSTFPASDTPVVIGVLGNDPFGRVLDEMVENEYVGTRLLVVRRLRRAEEATGCHLLFIAGSETRHMRTILRRLHGWPVLTVGDWPGFVEAGGMVGFGTRDGNLQLCVNPQAASSAGLVLSSKLLEVAQVTDSPAAAP